MTSTRCRSAPCGLASLLFAALLVSAPSAPAGAQSATSKLVGVLTVKWATPHGPVNQVVTLTTDDGSTYILRVDPQVGAAAGGLLNLDRRRVEVSGATLTRSAISTDAPPTVHAATLRLAPEAPAPEPRLSGSQKFATIACRFADSTGTTPKDTDYINSLVGTTYPGINHFWKENSFNIINNDGSVVHGWNNLPQPRSYYVFDNSGQPGVHFDRLAQDCTATADAAINFSLFQGINLLFNQNLDCCAWGGAQPMTLDGVNKAWPMTFMPPWGYASQDVLGHEMGHAYGLDHSSGPYDATYDSQWDVMSAGGTCGTSHPTHGCLGVHTISYHKDRLAWIGASRKYTAAIGSDQTITIEDIAAPPVGASSYLMAQLPIDGSSTNFYTVEVRGFAGYDTVGATPAKAAVIHKVDTTRSDRLAQVVDPDDNGNTNDAASQWLPGESYNTGDGFTVDFLSQDANGFQVRIRPGPTNPPTNDNFPGREVNPPVTGDSRSFWANTTSATTQGGEPTTVCSVTTGKTAWYRITPPSSGQLTIDTATSNFDTVLGVFTGSSVGTLTPVANACNDNNQASPQARVQFNATADTTYYVQVGGKNGASGLLKIVFSGNFPPPPPANDNFADAVAISGASGEVLNVKTGGATKQPGEPDHHGNPGGHSVWYRWTATEGGSATIDTDGSDFDTLLAVYTGTAVDGLTKVVSNDDASGLGLRSRVTFEATKGTTYRIAVDGYDGDFGVVDLHWTLPVGDGGDKVPVADFDGDGDSDIAVFRGSNGVWFTSSPATSTLFGASGDIPVPGDYDGDGNTDQAVFRPSNGVWYLNATPASAVPFGADGDIPVPADYNGDGTTDLAVFRPSNNVWYIQSPASSVVFGSAGDIPVPGDYNGDGSAEVAVFRPSTGAWYLTGPPASSPVFGANGDIPVPADYDGDGDTDIAVFRPSTNVWYIQSPASSVVFGAGGDQPQPGDYDGDGDTDIAVFRPSTGVWYVQSPAGATVFGTSGDTPLALPHAIRRAFF